jgi:hypothetical protein
VVIKPKVKPKKRVIYAVAIVLIVLLALSYINNTPTPGLTINFPFGNKLGQLNIYHGINIFLPTKDNKTLYIHNFSLQEMSSPLDLTDLGSNQDLQVESQSETNPDTYEGRQYSNSYETQKVGSISFKYPNDWKVQAVHNYAHITSPDYTPTGKGYESTGVIIVAEELNNKQAESLEQLENRLTEQYQSPYYTSSITKTRVENLSGIKLSNKIANVNTSPTGNYLVEEAIYLLNTDKIIRLWCTYITSRASSNAGEVCNNIIQSVSLN